MSICRARWAGSPACSRCGSIPARSISTRRWRAVPALGRALKRIKEQLRALPDHGLGYGLLRYLNPRDRRRSLRALRRRRSASTISGGLRRRRAADWAAAPRRWRLAAAAIRRCRWRTRIEVNALTLDGPQGATLQATWSWAPALLSEAEVRDLAQGWFAALEALVRHAEQPGAGGRSPCDLPLVALSQAEIERLEREYPQIEDILPLSPLQEGLLFHALYDAQAPDVYTVQLVLALAGAARQRGAARRRRRLCWSAMPACAPASGTRA